MRCFVPLALLPLIAACAAPPTGREPSLAPRAAEGIDPRIPIRSEVPVAPADAALTAQLGQLVEEARAAAPSFHSRLADAERLAAVAGPAASESWVAAEQALSLLIEQHGVTTRAAANIDELGSGRLRAERWIRPADQQAIAAAAAEVAAISARQEAAINRLKEQLAR